MGAAVDLELSDGQRFVRLSALAPQITVVNFWRHDCPPCLREIPRLAERTRAGQARLLMIALHRSAEDAQVPPALRDTLARIVALYAPGEARGLLARLGNPKGVLPHTAVLTPERQLCAVHSGEAQADWLDAAIARCAPPR